MSRVGEIIVAAALLLSGCSGPSALDTADAGRTVAYEPGVPNFDMESVVSVVDEVPVVDIYYSIPLASLAFIQSDTRYVAEYEIIVQLLDRESDRPAIEEIVTETVTVADYDSTVSHQPLTKKLTLTASPGDYIADVVITDASSGASARRRQAVEIVPQAGGDPFMSRPLLEGIRDGGAFEPVVSMHMPSMMDSLRASVQLYNLTGAGNLDVILRLINFESDTTIASPPYWLHPTRASLQYRGIDYDASDTVQVSRRPIRSAGESAVVVFSLPALPEGMYRMHVSTEDSEGGSVLARERLLSVKNPSFPSLTSLDDLIDALAYIAYADEIEHIREAAAAAERKRRFDAFWGSLVANRNLAANLLRLYYGRIEEANLFFTGYKEGWKTDRGMIYTIFGPPLYVDKRVELEVWHYSYGDRNPAQTFVFEKAVAQRDDLLETYILQRRPYYQYEWSRAVDRWRDGAVL